MFSIKINSSVVKFNLLVIFASVFAAFYAWFGGNQEMLKDVFSPATLSIITTIMGIINLALRTTNVKGLPPVEIVSKNTTNEEKK